MRQLPQYEPVALISCTESPQKPEAYKYIRERCLPVYGVSIINVKLTWTEITPKPNYYMHQQAHAKWNLWSCWEINQALPTWRSGKLFHRGARVDCIWISPNAFGRHDCNDALRAPEHQRGYYFFPQVMVTHCPIKSHTPAESHCGVSAGTALFGACIQWIVGPKRKPTKNDMATFLINKPASTFCTSNNWLYDGRSPATNSNGISQMACKVCRFTSASMAKKQSANCRCWLPNLYLNRLSVCWNTAIAIHLLKASWHVEKKDLF